jgi:hypothetical protein
MPSYYGWKPGIMRAYLAFDAKLALVKGDWEIALAGVQKASPSSRIVKAPDFAANERSRDSHAISALEGIVESDTPLPDYCQCWVASRRLADGRWRSLNDAFREPSLT